MDDETVHDEYKPHTYFQRKWFNVKRKLKPENLSLLISRGGLLKKQNLKLAGF